jgi:CheY-like chemotaxis protein
MQGGLGIGLTLVKSLVALHHGSVEAASDGPGKGSRLTVRLPLIAVPAQDHEIPWTTTREADGPKSFLVVDDNKLQAVSLGMLLESFGHQVKTAHDVAAALAVLEDFVPDLALIDLGLPGELDGCDLARRIRQQPRFAKTVLIAQTGWGRDEDRQRSHAAGFDYHLVKPIDHGQLQRIITGTEPKPPPHQESGGRPD